MTDHADKHTEEGKHSSITGWVQTCIAAREFNVAVPQEDPN